MIRAGVEICILMVLSVVCVVPWVLRVNINWVTEPVIEILKSIVVLILQHFFCCTLSFILYHNFIFAYEEIDEVISKMFPLIKL